VIIFLHFVFGLFLHPEHPASYGPAAAAADADDDDNDDDADDDDVRWCQ